MDAAPAMKHCHIAILAAVLMMPNWGGGPASAQAVKEPVPSTEALKDLLQKEPITVETWPAWRKRLLAWIHDRSARTDFVYLSAHAFLQRQVDAQGNLPPSLAGDHLAWYFLGSAYLNEQKINADRAALAAKAERVLRKSLELDRARSLGADPEKMLGPGLVREIETRGGPGWPERFGWIMLYFAGFYAAVMLAMALAGLLLASRTSGSRALGLLENGPEHLVEEGQVIRASGETMLARLYAMGLVAGLVLFYLSIPFIICGLLGTTALLIYLIFLAGRIPIKLVIVIIVVGLGAAWSVFKSLFSRPATGSFGLLKTAEYCPRLYQVIADVARRVDTDPVHEVYLAPGSEIGVHQEGRGPFGMLGVKRRVLTLGLATMRFLSVSELEAILAHEYAHFSHRDTFYSRFIYQVHMSIGQALWGMGQFGGYYNYANPFYWFLFLYYKCYSLLSAGFSRSREFLADRMASSLYGSDVFAAALTKVSTDGLLFEKTIYGSIDGHLDKQEASLNMYEDFHQYLDEQVSKEEREEEYHKLLEEKGSLFAQHPTFAERLKAVAELPLADKKDTVAALDLFDDPEETEKELTQFLTDYLAAIKQMQWEAAQAASQ
jgi:Zn-dependent protease with chaperone function